MATGGKSLLESRHLEDAIECSLCNEHFDNEEHSPKNLNCGHHYCLRCLCKLEKFVSDGRFTIFCPHCRTKNTIPSNGCTNFVTNFAVLSLAENYKSHFEQEAKKKHEDDTTNMCECGETFDHANFNFCSVCNLGVCDRCAWKKHKSHADNCHTAEEYFKKLKIKAKKSKDEGEELLVWIQQNLADTKKRSGLLTDQRKATEIAVKQHIHSLRSILDQREEKMLSDIKKYEEEKMVLVCEREKILEAEKSRLQNSLSLTEEIFVQNDQTGLIQMRNLLNEVVEKISTFQLGELPDLVTVENYVYRPSLSVVEAMKELSIGQIVFGNVQETEVDLQVLDGIITGGSKEGASKRSIIRYDRVFLISCRLKPASCVQPNWIFAAPDIVLSGVRYLKELVDHRQEHGIKKRNRNQQRPFPEVQQAAQAVPVFTRHQRQGRAADLPNFAQAAQWQGHSGSFWVFAPNHEGQGRSGFDQDVYAPNHQWGQGRSGFISPPNIGLDRPYTGRRIDDYEDDNDDNLVF